MGQILGFKCRVLVRNPYSLKPRAKDLKLYTVRISFSLAAKISSIFFMNLS